MNTQDLMAKLQAKYPYEKEYLQAVHEVLESIEEVYNQHPEFEDAKIVERIVEPERIRVERDANYSVIEWGGMIFDEQENQD